MIKIKSAKEWYERYVVNIDGDNCSCTDTTSFICCEWTIWQYNETNKMKVLDEEILINQAKEQGKEVEIYVAELSSLLGDFLFAFHYNLIFPNCSQRHKLITPLRTIREHLDISSELVSFLTNTTELDVIKADDGEVPYSVIFKLLDFYGLEIQIKPKRQ